MKSECFPNVPPNLSHVTLKESSFVVTLVATRGGLLDRLLALHNALDNLVDIREAVEDGERHLLSLAVNDQVCLGGGKQVSKQVLCKAAYFIFIKTR